MSVLSNNDITLAELFKICYTFINMEAYIDIVWKAILVIETFLRIAPTRKDVSIISFVGRVVSAIGKKLPNNIVQSSDNNK